MLSRFRFDERQGASKVKQKTIQTFWISAACAASVLAAGLVITSGRGNAQSTTPGPIDQALVEKGIMISPVPLNMNGKDRTKVGYGAFIVNAMSGCNDCHTFPAYAEGGDPFFGQPEQINTAGYLAGGTAFGPFISRNITPDATGKPAGLTLAEFREVVRTGRDFKNLHPPFGPLLQVMPWPVFRNVFDREIDAVYEFLSAIPCIEGGPGTQENRCAAPPATQAVAGPKNATVVTRQMDLDGTASTSGSGALKYFWTIPSGYPQAAVQRGNTATPTVQFGTTKGPYAFDLTVTDGAGNTSTDRATVLFQGY
jgi:hypothetical protein